jgi:hypothetical protein
MKNCDWKSLFSGVSIAMPSGGVRLLESLE